MKRFSQTLIAILFSIFVIYFKGLAEFTETVILIVFVYFIGLIIGYVNIIWFLIYFGSIFIVPYFNVKGFVSILYYILIVISASLVFSIILKIFDDFKTPFKLQLSNLKKFKIKDVVKPIKGFIGFWGFSIFVYFSIAIVFLLFIAFILISQTPINIYHKYYPKYDGIYCVGLYKEKSVGNFQKFDKPITIKINEYKIISYSFNEKLTKIDSIFLMDYDFYSINKLVKSNNAKFNNDGYFWIKADSINNIFLKIEEKGSCKQ